jgi:dTDP-4-amino-4,6-dideoxy-D-galactose acyltransferase
MNNKVLSPPEEILQPLPWDSAHFGLQVSEIVSPSLDDSTLYNVLRFARRHGIDIVYWATSPERHMPPSLLDNFSGILVDRKATFRCDLVPSAWTDRDMESSVFRIFEYPCVPATNRLLTLAVTAGHFSRFNVDPHIPKGKFISLYHTWMKRSTLRELADVVLVVTATGSNDDCAGIVTASAADTVGKIGLIAVLDAVQGQGLGSLLMGAIHRWMLGRGVKQSTVVTQLVNIAACKLYERLGYHLINVQHYYHFWPQIQKD